jgi:hypothetical protein
MADDPTDQPKPPAKRRRPPRTTTSKASSGSQPAADPGTDPDAVGSAGSALEPAAPPPDTTAAALVDPSAAGPSDAPGEAIPATHAGHPGDDDAGTSVWPMLDDRSPNEWVCPFLRSVDEDDHAAAPHERPDIANRCAALADVAPQSLRQQELVCLTTAHVNCPRYLRGAVATDEVAAAAQVRSTPTITPAMFGALALLAAAFSASVVFTLARGGMDLPAAAAPSAGPSSSAVAVVPTGLPSASPSVNVSLAPGATPTERPAPTPVASETPGATPAPSPETTPAASSSPQPSSGRYALLTACPDKPDCWIYRIRSGDNLFSIARYFGVPLATVRSLNPWTRTAALKAGRVLILPPPTR